MKNDSCVLHISKKARLFIFVKTEHEDSFALIAIL
uniref:Uncharacterized protein n=1 Tax=Parascaris equorum TaxID=6256 RepID=A0A914S7F7_PAREQ